MVMLCCCWIVSEVNAQTGWLSRYVDMGPNITGTNRATALARLEAIERLLKQVPELAHPAGFDITTQFTGHRSRTGLGNSEHPDYVIEYTLHLKFFAPKWVKFLEPAGEMAFTINANEGQDWLDPQGRGIYIEPARWPRSPFATVTYGFAESGGPVQPNDPFYVDAWLTAGGELPWRAVSREDYYAALIASAEGNKGERRADYVKAVEKTGYQRWLDEAPQRKKDREQTLKTVGQVSPAEVANLRKALEDAEREAGEQLKKNESAEREEKKTAFAPTDTMRAELSRMTPAQRKLPAILDTDIGRTEWRATGATMLERDTLAITVHRVLTPNYDFWRARKSPVDVRTIRVYFRAMNSPPPAILTAVYQTYKKLDWRALAALLDQPTRE
jgi:hypothetical protein